MAINYKFLSLCIIFYDVVITKLHMKQSLHYKLKFMVNLTFIILNNMEEIKFVNSLEDLENILQKSTAVLLYFSTNSCNVGEALEPKVLHLLNTDFPKIAFYKVDMNFSPEIAAKYSAFVEPTILVFFEGKETFRKSRNIGLHELQTAILRPYKLIF